MPMTTGRANRFACAAEGSNVYVAGGIGNLGVLCSADVLNLKHGVWATLPQMVTPRFHCGAAMNQGQFVVFGGQFEQKCEALNLQSREVTGPTSSLVSEEVSSWTNMPELPFKDMWVRAVAAEHRFFALGRTTASMLDPGHNEWIPFPSIPGCHVITVCAVFVPSAMEE
eukprot:gnl/MRDRNA2_/MRDRNA2_80214_c0_seq2.p1 gnl/MRDRNA2_/MRDRNA2_80214_c0~~gnl/MRDRNA2_/MRDRNA2_80214_c0_seq2.p1  ORF type:complete len:169 (+),score=20.06 gnl/MRDRNA2_/MRDRNA2_80214_c0_seq2:198-704(+)